MTYAPNASLRDARQQYFDKNNFGDGGYSDKWVKLKLGPIPFAFPNTPARIRAVRLHDLHHLLTEYGTDYKGEAEIAGWEIASSCGTHYAAWMLNLTALAYGVVIWPAPIYCAFLRGRYSRNYYAGEYAESLLLKTVGEARREFHLDRAIPSSTAADNLSFASWSLLAILTMVVPFAIVVALIVTFIRWL